jgi:hypothetical protein
VSSVSSAAAGAVTVYGGRWVSSRPQESCKGVTTDKPSGGGAWVGDKVPVSRRVAGVRTLEGGDGARGSIQSLAGAYSYNSAAIMGVKTAAGGGRGRARVVVCSVVVRLWRVMRWVKQVAAHKLSHTAAIHFGASACPHDWTVHLQARHHPSKHAHYPHSRWPQLNVTFACSTVRACTRGYDATPTPWM